MAELEAEGAALRGEAEAQASKCATLMEIQQKLVRGLKDAARRQRGQGGGGGRGRRQQQQQGQQPHQQGQQGQGGRQSVPCRRARARLL